MNGRRKGRAGELEFAKLFGGHRISEAGMPGPDVQTPPVVLSAPLEVWEVKRTERLRIWAAIDQAERAGADALAFRRNRGDWYVLVRADQLVANG